MRVSTSDTEKKTEKTDRKMKTKK